jgi:hypothetical protein
VDKPDVIAKKQSRKPTLKQRKAISNLVANGGNVAQAMRAAGYSEAMARNPQKLTESEYVQTLMQEVGLTDKDAFQQLKDGLQANKTVVMGKDDDSFVDIQPDHATRHKYLETHLRLRGIGTSKDQATTNFNFINVSREDKDAYGL